MSGLPGYDQWLGRHQHYPVHVTCECGEEWDDEYEEEYGQGWLHAHEQCPACGSDEINIDPWDDVDIAEARARARGDDF